MGLIDVAKSKLEEVDQFFEQLYRILAKSSVALTEDDETFAALEDADRLFVKIEKFSFHGFPNDSQIILRAKAILQNAMLELLHHLQEIEQ